jgi:hypothetical protein
MKEPDVRRAAALLKARNELIEWRDTLVESVEEHPAETLASFGEINVRLPDERDYVSLHGWQGDLQMPRDIAIRMLDLAAKEIYQELQALGVEM